MRLLEQWRSRFLTHTGQPAQSQADDSPPVTYQFTLPPEHPLCALRDLWSSTPNSGFPLQIGFIGEDDPPSKEKDLLLGSLTRLATKRIRQIFQSTNPNVMDDLDEAPFLYISGDGMTAWLMLLPAVGEGLPLTIAQLEQNLNRRGIIYGVDHQLLTQILTLPQPYFQLFPIAHGTPPVPGEDGRVVDHYPRAAGNALPVDELAHANYETLQLVQNIHQGDVICEIIPPTEGMPGRTVLDRVLPGKPGSPAQVPQGRNTALSEDGCFLLAVRDGHVEFRGRNFQVKPILEIKDDVVSDATKINFLGDVHIHGDVCRGAVIRAMGSIQIDGVVEDCFIEAGEDLIVSSGVQGQGHGLIQAHRNIYAKYLEHCRVCAQEGVHSDCIIDCEVYSNGTVQAYTGRGAIIGGTIRAAERVEATTVGSKAERSTEIILGGMPCEDLERQQIRDEVEQTTQALQELNTQPHSPEREQAACKLRMGLCVAQMKLERLENAAEHTPAPCADSDHRCLVCDALYPGATVTIEHMIYRVSHMEGNCTIGLANGRVGHIIFR